MAERIGTWIAIYCPTRRMVLMAKRSERVNNPYFWNFFGGQMDIGETPKTAAIRELREETGIKARKKDLIKVAHLRLEGPGYAGIERDLYFFLLLTEDLIEVRLNMEHSECRWFKKNHLPFSVTRVTQVILDNGLLKKAIAHAVKHSDKEFAT